MTRVAHAVWLFPLLLATPAALAEGPVSVEVRTEAPRAGTVPQLITVYGTAAPAFDGGMTLSLQQEGRVLAIAVTPGERVSAGERLVDFASSSAAIVTYQQAVSALEATIGDTGSTGPGREGDGGCECDVGCAAA
jgi:multidrug efflux pump subunit AcrA (membrane-fusion protein)